MSFGYTAGNMTILASAAVSSIIDGGGCTLVGLDFTTTVDGTGFYIKEGPSASDLKNVYDEGGVQLTVTLPAAAAAAAVNVRLPPEKHYAMRYFQVCASSSQGTAVTIRPVWARPLDS